MSYKISGVEFLKDDGTVAGFQNVTVTNFFTLTNLTSGYSSGGDAPPYVNTIDKFAFASDGNATDVGDLTQSRSATVGASSSTYGYTTGGNLPSPGPSGKSNVIDKFPFASDANASDVGNMLAVREPAAGNQSLTHGYTSGGPGSNVIEKYPFSTDGNSTDVGDLATSGAASAGQNSTTHGYVSGNYNPPGSQNVIQKFSFITDGNGSDVGDLTQARHAGAGQSSTTHGYTSGGYGYPSPLVDTIDNFPFATDTNATDVGNLTVARYYCAAQSYVNQGYSSGGNLTPPVGKSNVIDKFPFATNANATDVGDISQTRFGAAGTQG